MQEANTVLKIRLLRAFEVQRGPDVLLGAEWRRRKAQSVIKLLALQTGRRMHREQAAELLWPGLRPESAANNLNQNLHHIRSTMAKLGAREPLIVAVGNSLSIPFDVVLDLDELRAAAARAHHRGNVEAYRQALAAWGELLPDDLYEPWTERPRRELSRLHRDLLVEFSALEIGPEARATAIEELERLVAADPLDEGAHRALMRIRAAAGDRLGAVRQYRELRETLRREVDVAPSRETEEAYQEIVVRTGDAPRRADGATAAAATASEQGALRETAATRDERESSARYVDTDLVVRIAHCAESAVAECARHPWPAFVTNEFAEVVGANPAFERLVGIDLGIHETPIGERNLMSVASDPAFGDRLVNWDEAMTTIISVFKASDAAPENIARPGTYLAAVLERFLGGDPAYVNRLIRLWQDAPSTWDRKEHWTYPIVWRGSGRRLLRFTGVVTSASLLDRLTFNDWIPLDATTWRELARMTGAGSEGAPPPSYAPSGASPSGAASAGALST